jgi:hypothetical protein
VDTTLEEIIIKERRGIRRANKRQQSEEDENLVDILLGLQERRPGVPSNASFDTHVFV